MSKTKKVFPLRLTEEQHKNLQGAAEKAEKSMHQFTLDAIEKENANREAYDLIFAAYNTIKAGSAPDLEKALFEWIIKNNNK